MRDSNLRRRGSLFCVESAEGGRKKLKLKQAHNPVPEKLIEKMITLWKMGLRREVN